MTGSLLERAATVLNEGTETVPQPDLVALIDQLRALDRVVTHVVRARRSAIDDGYRLPVRLSEALAALAVGDSGHAVDDAPARHVASLGDIAARVQAELDQVTKLSYLNGGTDPERAQRSETIDHLTAAAVRLAQLAPHVAADQGDGGPPVSEADQARAMADELWHAVGRAGGSVAEQDRARNELLALVGHSDVGATDGQT